MIQVHNNLFVGNQSDYDRDVAFRQDWAVVHACKDPYHRQALGYGGRAVSPQHPEYLMARRGNRLILNMVDVDRPDFFNKERLIDPALTFLDEMLTQNMSVLVHCNQGESRSPSLALLYMATRLHVLPHDTFEAAESSFRPLYPPYNPKAGIRGHLILFWSQYCADGVSRS